MVVAPCGENGDSVSLCVRLPVLNKSNKLDMNTHHLSGSCPPSLSTWGWAHGMEGDLCSSLSLSQRPFLYSPPQSGSPLSFLDLEFPPQVRCQGWLRCQPEQKAAWSTLLPACSLGGGAPGRGLPLTGQASHQGLPSTPHHPTTQLACEVLSG